MSHNYIMFNGSEYSYATTDQKHHRNITLYSLETKRQVCYAIMNHDTRTSYAVINNGQTLNIDYTAFISIPSSDIAILLAVALNYPTFDLEAIGKITQDNSAEGEN